jgi:RHS repeat-associated protein
MMETYAAGLHLGTYILNSAGTDTIFYYDHSDWLGTERARTNLSGAACETIVSLPFGDGQTVAGSCGDISPMHFTGKERDSESGLDNFEARYFGSSMGRFMSPGPEQIDGFDHLESPQAWNGYAYVHNNPLNATDPRWSRLYLCQQRYREVRGLQQGDCDNSTEEKANSGIYVNGTVDTIYTSTGNSQGVVAANNGQNAPPGVPKPPNPILQNCRIIRGCSRLLLWVGAAIFFVGDAYLYEIKHVNFLVSAAVGILGGSLVMLLAAGIAVACKSGKPERH